MHYILFFTLMINSAFALINKPIHSQIISINPDEKRIYIKPVTGAQVGMYGLIIKSFDTSHSTALSWVEVLSITAESIEVKTTPIVALEQSALPSGTWEPKLGDKVTLGYNYHRALLISPNASVYKKISSFHKQRRWVHPDIFASVLSSNGHPSPLIEDFKSTCRANNIGLIGFVLKNSFVTVDCQSFKIIEVKSSTLDTTEVQLPFYTRVSQIEANWFGEGSNELTEYTPYYTKLLAKSNPDNAWLQSFISQDTNNTTQGE